MRPLRYVLIDVFTDEPLAGNALAVFTNATDLSTGTMQRLAREMNLAETVFVLRPSEGGHARLRIFTPTRELPFAGHPTLGAAFVLGQPMQLGEIRLETEAGIVPVVLEREGPRVAFGWMSQPLPRVEPLADPAPLFAALGVTSSTLPVERYDLGPTHIYIALETPEAVSAVAPDLRALAAAADAGVNVFAGRGKRVKTRMFAPAHGVPEDAATGSAAGPLAWHLARHGRIAYGDEIAIEQGSEVGRPARLHARAHGNDDRLERLEVGGSAVVIGRGEVFF